MHVVYEQNLHDEEVVIGYSKPQICALVAQQGPRAFLGLEVKKLWGNALWQNFDQLVKNSSQCAKILY